MPTKDPVKRREQTRARVQRHRQRKAGAEVPVVLPDPPDRMELLKILGVQARSGHVTAIRTLLEEYRRDGADDNEVQAARSVIDELAQRRAARA